MSIIKNFLIVILIITNLTSCETIRIWQNTKYNEDFKDFLVTKDNKKIVILGQKYHYAFDDKSGDLSKLLFWESKSKIIIENQNIRVKKIDKIIASATVKCRIQQDSGEKLSEQEISYLQKLGFTSDEVFLKKNFTISGTRYSPKSDVNFGTIYSFDNEYRKYIQIDDYTTNAKKIALTPVGIVGDIVSIVIGPFVLITLYLTKSTCRNKFCAFFVKL